MKDLLTIIAELGIKLHPDRISILADKISVIDSVEHFALIKSTFGPGINKEIISKFEVAWKDTKGISPQK